MCSVFKTLIYHCYAFRVEEHMTEFQNYPIGQPNVVRTLYCRRKRSIESYVKTVTEVWVGDRLSRIIVSDLTRRLETEEELMPNFNIENHCIGKMTATVNATQHEYVCPEVETQTARVDGVQSNVGSWELVKTEAGFPPICVPLCRSY